MKTILSLLAVLVSIGVHAQSYSINWYKVAGGGGTLSPTTASGAPQPVQASAAKIRQGALEGSNVDMSKEMALMVSTQRAYQMSSSAIQTESQMMSIANELRPS